MKRCFVISPIGAEGSATRKHADKVYKWIIEPAMKECGIEAFRSDHLQEPGKISEQMISSILTSDVCVAVLTEHNPNVFYELAIAQSTSRPVIILIEKGQELPFDIQDLRCVYYDLEIDSYEEKTYINQVIHHVRNLEAKAWNVPSVFSQFQLVPISSSQRDPMKFFLRSEEFGSSQVWLKLLNDTEHVFEIMGLTLSSWPKTKGFKELLRKKAEGGCKVKILLLHKDHPAWGFLINDNIRSSLDYHPSRIAGAEIMLQQFSEIAATTPNVEVRQVRKGIPHYQVTRTDQFVNLICYLYSERTANSPMWQCTKDTGLYRTMAEEFEVLWNLNEG
jgi:hypothetical protein